jgi:uncharacterized protein YndB with AHSA1/START domain
MYEGQDRSSISLTTVEIVPESDGTRLTYTEHGAFLDDLDKPEGREEGIAFILDGLAKYLAARSNG